MQLITMSKVEFISMFREVIKNELTILKANWNKTTHCEILSRKQAAAILEINLSTLWDWTKEGKIKSHKIGGRVYYRQSEINSLLIPEQ